MLKKNARKRQRAPRPLVTISGSDGGWDGQWTQEHIFSIGELRLADLAEDGEKDAEVFIRLSVQKHTGFGFSVDGRIITSFTRKCSNCSSPFCREMNTTFKVWVLPAPRVKHENEMPEIGGNDPSVIYVKPGSEVDLDSLIQDTIRLAASLKDTCSEACDNSTPTWHCMSWYLLAFKQAQVHGTFTCLSIGATNSSIWASRVIASKLPVSLFEESSKATTKYADFDEKETYVDKRWSKLLELKNSM